MLEIVIIDIFQIYDLQMIKNRYNNINYVEDENHL